MTDYYEILEVHPNASPEVIARAYRVLAARYHPDLHPPERRAWAEEMMKRVNEAFGVLSDPQKRAAYNQTRNSSPTAQVNAVSAPTSSAPTASAQQVAVVNAAVCVFHPSRPRISTCLECRRSVCEECRVLRDGRPYCRECAQRLAEPATSQPATPAPLTRRASGEAQSPRLRLSVWGWVNTSLAICALAVWLYVIVAPKIVNDKATMILIAPLCAAVAMGIVFSLLIALRPWRLTLQGVGASIGHVLVLLMLVAFLWMGGHRAMELSGTVQQNIAGQEAERARQASKEEAEGYLDNFITSFPGHEKPKKGVWKQLSDGAWKWLERNTGLAEEQETQLNAEEVESFPNDLSPDKLNAPRGWAKKFLDAEYSKRPEQTQNRAVCLHFIIWAELKQPTGNMTGQAKDCLKIAQRPEQKADCFYYLAQVAYQGDNLDNLQRYRQEFAQSGITDPQRLGQIDLWIQQLQRKRIQEGTKAHIVALTQSIGRGDADAAQQGLNLINQETATHLPNEVDQLTQALLSFFHARNDLQSLTTLQQSYAAARPNGPQSQPIAKAIGTLQEQQRQRQEQVLRQRLHQQVNFVRQLIRRNDLRAKDEGLKVLKPELQQWDEETFEALTSELGTWLYQRKDSGGLRQLQSQYLNVSRLKRQQAQFDQWLNELTPPAQPTPPQGAQGGH